MKHLQFAPGELKEEFNTYAQKSILCRMDKRRPGRMVELCRLYIRNDRTRRQEHLVNALALRGEEGRSTLRKAAGRREHPLIRGDNEDNPAPNAAIPVNGIRIYSVISFISLRANG